MTARVAVVVLTWNGCEDTLECLDSVAALDWPELDVVVADNGSADGTVAAVHRRFPGVHVVENGANLGFAEGNNRGIAAALERGADAVLILNNDTTVPPGLLRSLVDALDDGVGAVCPVIHHADGERIWFAGSRYDPARGHAGRPSPWERGRAPLPAGPVEIDRAVGAAMLVPRTVVERLGAFAPELFYLFEDVEWSLRMRRAGLRVLLDPRVSVRHRVAASQDGHARTPVTLYYGTRNDLEVRRRAGTATVGRELICVASHVAAALGSRERRLACAAASLAGWADFRRGRLGPRAA
ncbi:MAG: hypothetical protein QOI80_905 [Solirubrobacteraceae bacterium]|nr:hypothetical protein [Solirubrobacteraceae bacterium]